MWCKVWDSLTLLTQWMRRRSSMKATPWLFIVHQSTVDLRPSGTSLSTHQHFTFVQVSATATATAFIRTFTAEWVVLGTLNVAPWPVGEFSRWSIVKVCWQQLQLVSCSVARNTGNTLLAVAAVTTTVQLPAKLQSGLMPKNGAFSTRPFVRPFVCYKDILIRDERMLMWNGEVVDGARAWNDQLWGERSKFKGHTRPRQVWRPSRGIIVNVNPFGLSSLSSLYSAVRKVWLYK